MTLILIVQLLYFMIPAYVANMLPVFVKKLPVLNIPIDSNKKLFGKPLFGSHKTWRGLVFGILGGVLAGFVQSLIGWNALSIDYAQVWFFLSLWLSTGALSGDIAKSFFKRRVGISEGNSWKVFDQIDYSIGALVLASQVYWPGWLNAFFIVLISAVGHVLVNHLGFWLGIRDKNW